MTNNVEISRRRVIALAASTLAVAVSPSVAMATTTASAKRLVKKVVKDINKVIDSGAPEAEMLDQFEQIFVDYADVDTIARYALGVEGRSASSAQMAAFTKAFQR